MKQFFESIRVVNGRVMNLFWHQKRVNETTGNFDLPSVVLQDYLTMTAVPENGIYKFRLSYGEEGVDFQWKAYDLSPIQTLQLVEEDSLDYYFKNENRDALAKVFNKKNTSDDVLIIKDGKITDTSYGNILFEKNDQWFTPKTFLLNGTMRQRLLQRGMIQEADIAVEDVHQYDSYKVINAMRPPSMVPSSDVSNILR